MPLLQNPRGRQVQSLDGKWQMIADPYESGYYGYRGTPNPHGYFLDRRPVKGSNELVEYDFDASPNLDVPGDWNSQREDLRIYEGNVWYRRRFNTAPKLGRRQILRFEAVNYECVVWLNGIELGRHEGGFTPFEYEVTGKLKTGANSLILKVDNRRKRDGVPTLQTDWWNYGGITRSVLLIDLAATYIHDYTVSLAADGGIDAWAKLEGPAAAGVELSLALPALKLVTKVTTNAKGEARWHSGAKPDLWSPEQPRAYEATLSLGEEKIKDRFAFRSIATRGADILLNGKPVFLRGISLHEEAAGPKAGRLRKKADATKLLSWAKALGCNFVRLAHYPHDEMMTREAERLGLMVWQEIPVYWTIAWENPATEALAHAQLEAMIARDRNRGAVVLWSVGNETPLSEPRLKFMAGLAKRAKALDPTRLITAALEQHGGDEREVNDALGSHLDVLGLNEYIGWYDGPPEKCRQVTYKCAWDKPLIISEFGADAKAGLRGKKEERWTEDYQAFVYREQLAMLQRIPNLRGLSPWILKDFRSPRRPLPGIQDGWNRKGLQDERGKKKLAWTVLNQFYKAKAKAAAQEP